MSGHSHSHAHGDASHSHSHNHDHPHEEITEHKESTSDGHAELSTIQVEQPVIKDIFYAASVGDFDLLRKFVEQDKVDVKSKGEDDVTCLHWAAFKDHFQIAKYLCDHGAEIDAPTKQEAHTPLMWACISGNIKLVYHLLQQGADVNKVDVRGYNALHHAVQYNQTVITHFLIGRGLFLDSRDGEGHTPLMWASYCNHEDTTRYLLQQGADVNSQDHTGCTSLHWAASKGNIKIVKILLNEANADPTKKDKDGITAAEVAQKKQFFNISKLLSGRNYSANQKNNFNSIDANLFKIQIMWWLVFLIGVPAGMILLSQIRSFLLGVVIIIGCMYIVKFTIGPFWLDLNYRNPSWVGIVMGAYALSNYSYFTSVIFHTNQYVVETILFFIINMTFGPLYLKLLLSDPGSIKVNSQSAVVKKSEIKEETNHSGKSTDTSSYEWKMYLESLEKDELIPQFCLTCMVRKPIRGKHCRTCNKCIAKFDHHCGWINNCVGVKNHVPFMCCLILVILNHYIFIHFCSIALSSNEGAPPLLPINHSLPFYFENEPLTVILLFFHAMNAFWQTMLFYNLAKGIRDNITTNETINKSRYSYMKHPDTGKFFNPFNRGSVNNIKDFFSSDIDWYHLYHIPKHFYPFQV